MSEIVTVTVNAALDVSMSVGQVTPDRKLRCSQPRYDPGGGGVNVCRAVRELGGECLALWNCGGPMGELLRRLLDEEGADHIPVEIEGFTRQSVMVHEDSSNRQYRFVAPGPELSDGEVERLLAKLGEVDPPPRYVVVSGSLPPGAGEDFYARLARSAPEGARVLVDTGGEALKAALEAGVHLIKPNVRELSRLTGRDARDDEEIVRSAREIVASGGAEVVVVSLGAGGAELVTADAAEHVRAPTAPVRSKVGAGDSMVAGLVSALARGESVRDAVRFAVAAGAAAVMTPGTGLCRRGDTERLYASMGE